MGLVTANLPVKSIIQTLGVANAKAIFYNGDGSLKTIAQLGALVDKNGLNAAYCPGATADERLANLRANRNLKYFKGYNHNAGYLTCNPDYLTFNGGGSLDFSIISNLSWTITESVNWITVNKTSGTGNDTVTVTAAANPGTETWHGSIKVQAGDITRYVTVNQPGSGSGGAV